MSKEIKKEFRTFTPIIAGTRDIIKVVELQEKAQTEGIKESERLKTVQQIVSIVTGGEYDPKDQSYDITNKHAVELIQSFLSQ